jgi:hypothetical protein
MLLQNNARRLIQINSNQKLQYRAGDVVGAKGGKKYRLKPAGSPVDIPEKVCILNHKYIYLLLAANDVLGNKDELDVIMKDHWGTDGEPQGDESQDDKDPYEGCSRADLVLMAESMDVDVPKSWTMPKIIEAIEAVEAEAEAEE